MLKPAKKTNRRPSRDPEHHLQVAVANWALLNEWQYPKLKNLFAIPNGGLRAYKTSKKLKAEGVRSGVPDMMLAVVTKRYPGMYIEHKIGSNTLSNNQVEWKNRLKDEGYLYITSRSHEFSIEMIKKYLFEFYGEMK